MLAWSGPSPEPLAEPPHPGSTLGAASPGRDLVPGRRLEDAPGLVGSGPSPSPHPAGMGSAPLLGAVGLGAAGLGVCRGCGISPGCWGWGASRLEGSALLLPGSHEVFPTPCPRKGAVLRRMGNFPLCVRHCGCKAQGGLRPGGCGAGAERSTPVPPPLEPSRGHSLAAGGQRAASPLLRLPALVSRRRAAGPAAGAGRGTEQSSAHTRGLAGTRLSFTPSSPCEPLSPLPSPLQRQHPSPSLAVAPGGMWSHRGSGEWGAGVPGADPEPFGRPGDGGIPWPACPTASAWILGSGAMLASCHVGVRCVGGCWTQPGGTRTVGSAHPSPSGTSPRDKPWGALCPHWQCPETPALPSAQDPVTDTAPPAPS